MRKPDFNNILKILDRKEPDRPTLFEFFMNPEINMMLAGEDICKIYDELNWYRICVYAFYNAGYDYVTMNASAYPAVDISGELRFSDNQRPVRPISSWEDLKDYEWPDPNKYDYSILDKVGEILPEGMKIIAHQYDGIWEMVQKRIDGGYAGAAMLIADDRALAKKVFDEIGERYLDYYKITSKNEYVGACLCNDDWGFNSQTMLNPDDLREFVFPWYKKIVKACHENNKPIILHSCGKLDSVMDDIIYDMKFDGKHSYEDKITPVEQFYEQYHDKIAILGGMDMDFVCRASKKDIIKRCEEMLERVKGRGGYALGTGNSVPDWMPKDKFLTLVSTINPDVKKYIIE